MLLCEAVQEIAKRIGDVLLSKQTHDVYECSESSTTAQPPAVRAGQDTSYGNNVEPTVLRERLTDMDVTLSAATCSSCSQIIPTAACVERSTRPEGALRAAW